MLDALIALLQEKDLLALVVAILDGSVCVCVCVCVHARAMRLFSHMDTYELVLD